MSGFAEKYLKAVNSFNLDDVLSLFADGFIFCSPFGNIIQEKHKLSIFYQNLLDKRALLIPTSCVSNKNSHVLELSVHAKEAKGNELIYDPEAPLRTITIDHFTLMVREKLSDWRLIQPLPAVG